RNCRRAPRVSGNSSAFALADVPMQAWGFFYFKGFSTDGNHYQRLRFSLERLKAVFQWKDYRSLFADEAYPKMWRVVRPDGSLSDMANVTRARNAALTQALRDLNAKETAPEGSRTRSPDSAYGRDAA